MKLNEYLGYKKTFKDDINFLNILEKSINKGDSITKLELHRLAEITQTAIKLKDTPVLGFYKTLLKKSIENLKKNRLTVIG